MAAFSPPFHILSYGTLLGTTFWHSFSGFIIFSTVERPQFGAIQTKLFPIYFSLQTAASAVLAVTHPDNSGGLNVGGVLEPANKWGALVPIATMFVTGLLNLTVLLPASRKVMERRRAQEKKDGKRYWEPAPQSEEMKALNKEFGMLHGISSLLNLSTFIGALVYGFHLGGRLQ